MTTTQKSEPLQERIMTIMTTMTTIIKSIIENRKGKNASDPARGYIMCFFK